MSPRSSAFTFGHRNNNAMPTSRRRETPHPGRRMGRSRQWLAQRQAAAIAIPGHNCEPNQWARTRQHRLGEQLLAKTWISRPILSLTVRTVCAHAITKIPSPVAMSQVLHRNSASTAAPEGGARSRAAVRAGDLRIGPCSQRGIDIRTSSLLWVGRPRHANSRCQPGGGEIEVEVRTTCEFEVPASSRSK